MKVTFSTAFSENVATGWGSYSAAHVQPSARERAEMLRSGGVSWSVLRWREAPS